MLKELLRPTPSGSLDGLIVAMLRDLPLDDPPDWEGDDSVHGSSNGTTRLALDDPRHNVVAVPGPRSIPFVRVVHARDHGDDVLAFQRALVAIKIRKRRPTGWHGPVSVANVKAFQKSVHLPVTGVYTQETHHHLLHGFDAYGSYLMVKAQRWQRVHSLRLGVVAAALYGVSVRDRIDYTQGPHRLDAILHRWKPPRFPIATDCSGFATWTYQVAGAPDPCGSNYNIGRLHFTGTMATHGVRVETPQIADLGLYGQGPIYEHVTIYIGNGRCVSLGSAPGPLLLPVVYRPDFSHFRSYIGG